MATLLACCQQQSRFHVVALVNISDLDIQLFSSTIHVNTQFITDDAHTNKMLVMQLLIYNAIIKKKKIELSVSMYEW